MTDPTENEEINEELSTDELKSVSGGYTYRPHQSGGYTDSDIDPYRPGSGSGMTNEDYKKSKEKRRVEFGNRCFVKQSYD